MFRFQYTEGSLSCGLRHIHRGCLHTPSTERSRHKHKTCMSMCHRLALSNIRFYFQMRPKQTNLSVYLQECQTRGLQRLSFHLSFHRSIDKSVRILCFPLFPTPRWLHQNFQRQNYLWRTSLQGPSRLLSQHDCTGMSWSIFRYK